MKKDVLNEIIEKKKQKIEFAIVTDIECGESFVFTKDKPINDNFKPYLVELWLYLTRNPSDAFLVEIVCVLSIFINVSIQLLIL